MLPNEDYPSRAGDPPPSERTTGSVLSTLARRLPTILIATVVVAGAVAVLSYRSRDTYKSTAQLLFSQTLGPDYDALGVVPVSVDAPTQIADDTAQVASRQVAAAAAQRMGTGVSLDSVLNEVTVTGGKTGNVVAVTASTHPAQRAAALANAYAASALQLIQARQATQTRATASALATELGNLGPKQSAGPVGVELRIWIAKLRALESAGTGSPAIIQTGYVPGSPSGNPAETIALGVLLGLVLGMGLALLREQGDQRLRRAEDVSAAFAAPVLATIPNDRALIGRRPEALRRSTSESLQMLQAHLRYGFSDPPRALMVTSSRGREGKTTIAWNLASTAAASGLSVILVDADLRRSSLAFSYSLTPFPGLAEVLQGEVSLEQAIQRASLSGDEDRQGRNGSDGQPADRSLDVLIAGAAPSEPSALLQSQQMTDILETLKLRYDCVIVDTPPIAQVADAIALLQSVDVVLLAASARATRGPEAQAVRNQLRALDARVAGVVVNAGSKARAYGIVGRQAQPARTGPRAGG